MRKENSPNSINGPYRGVWVPRGIQTGLFTAYKANLFPHIFLTFSNEFPSSSSSFVGGASGGRVRHSAARRELAAGKDETHEVDEFRQGALLRHLA